MVKHNEQVSHLPHHPTYSTIFHTWLTGGDLVKSNYWYSQFTATVYSRNKQVLSQHFSQTQ